ncbi:MAG: GntP family permease [Flavobacteriaceae bacterium]|nr:GntP family permease [Flavobacteriaceae bacterium]
MYIEIFFIIITVVWIIFGTSFLKWHPFLVLFIGSLLLGVALNIKLADILSEIFLGFTSTTKNIGLLIFFGTLIGASLEKSGATTAIAIGILKRFSKLPLTYLISLIGFIVSIPVFCDAAFVILSALNKKLSELSKSSKTTLTVALSTGLFAPHVLVPPTPGPLAAAATLGLKNIFMLFICGGVLALILILVGAFYSQNFIKRSNVLSKENLKKLISQSDSEGFLSFKLASSPIWVPILFMSLRPLINSNFSFITTPIFALFMGVIISFYISIKKTKFKSLFTLSLKQAIPIIAITGMGGALGKIIQNINIISWFEEINPNSSLGIIIPFLISATLKTAQGSSTIAIITTASIILPMLTVFGLDNEIGKVGAILAIGVGSMTVSHANDSYFWIVSQMGGLDVKTAYKTHTFATLIQGLTGVIFLLITFNLLKLF